MEIGTLASNRQAALDWVNAMRTEWGLAPIADLIAGEQQSMDACCLGNSCNTERDTQLPRAEFTNKGEVDVLKAVVGIDKDGMLIMGETVKLPPEVATFEHDFERGFYPELKTNSEQRLSNMPYYAEDGAVNPWWGTPTAEDSPLQLA